MSFLSRLLGYEDNKKATPVRQQPSFYNEDIPDAFDLGLHYSENKNENRVVKVSEQDRAKHVYVVGSSGSGKTRLLSHILRQDVVKGQGFALVDPHGDLFHDTKCFIASRCLDNPELSDNVIIIDPTDTRNSVVWNILEPIPGVSVAEQAEELIGAFRKIWSDAWGIRLETLLRNSLIALGEAGLTLCELSPFLTRRQFRRVVIEKVDNPTAVEYFRRFDSMTDRAQITWIEPVLNKVDTFLANERIRHMFSSPRSTFNLREAMDNKKHILINLNKGKIKGASDLLGSLMMAKISMAAFSRSDIEQHQRVPFSLFVDEFQNYASESFKVVLSEARKYGLSLVLAHQSLSQIPDDLRDIILSNAGLQIYFRTNRKDSQVIAKEIFPYSGSWEREIKELQDLPPRTCIAKHHLQGGIMRLRTQDVNSAHEMPGQDNIPRLGMKYMLPREELIAQARERRRLIEEAAKAAVPAQPQNAATKPPVAVSEPIPTKNIDRWDKEEPKPAEPSKQSRSEAIRVPTSIELPDVTFATGVKDIKVEREHRRLQHLIKHLAEQSGYLATIEQPTTDGQGRVDVGLEQDGKRIACEISVTTPPEHELANIRKCLASEYDTVILCSPEKKALEKIRNLCTKKLAEPELQRVLFLEPDALVMFFEEEAAKNAGKTGKVKGYKVKLNFQPQSEAEKKSKRQAVAQVVLQSFKRDKQK